MELIPHSCGLKLTQLESLAELERAGTSTAQSFASADFTLVLWVQPKPPPPPLPQPPAAGGSFWCCNRRRLGWGMGMVPVAGVEGMCIQQPPVRTESRFSCAPAAPAAFSQRALFILLNPVNERCRMKSPGSQYLPVTHQLLHGQCLAEQLPPFSPCHVWQPAVPPSALRDEGKGQSVGPLCAAVPGVTGNLWTLVP